MKIEQIELQQHGAVNRLSGVVGGHTVWFEFPAEVLRRASVEPFVSAALMPAMITATPIEVPDDWPVSAKLLEGLEQLQKVYAIWYPDLTAIDICAKVRSGQPNPQHQACASFFSGGIDSLQTAIERSDEISHLVFVKGIDMQLDNDELCKATVKVNQKYADMLNVKLVCGASNIRNFGHKFDFGWTRYVGGGLAAIAHALGFSTHYVPSSVAYDELEEPYGTHPLTDRFWSSDDTQFIDSGSHLHRAQKLQIVAEHPELLDKIRVCWQDDGFNCGKCEKCLRTMVGLKILDKTCSTLPALTDYRALSKLRLHDWDSLAELRSNMVLARRVGNTDVEARLAKLVRRADLKRALIDLDQLATGGWAKRIALTLLGRSKS